LQKIGHFFYTPKFRDFDPKFTNSGISQNRQILTPGPRNFRIPEPQILDTPIPDFRDPDRQGGVPPRDLTTPDSEISGPPDFRIWTPPDFGIPGPREIVARYDSIFLSWATKNCPAGQHPTSVFRQKPPVGEVPRWHHDHVPCRTPPIFWGLGPKNRNSANLRFVAKTARSKSRVDMRHVQLMLYTI